MLVPSCRQVIRTFAIVGRIFAIQTASAPCRLGASGLLVAGILLVTPLFSRERV
jgi:hypothetical protein